MYNNRNFENNQLNQYQNHTTRDMYIDPRYYQKHVGGTVPPIDNKTYIRNQLNVINNSRNNLPPKQMSRSGNQNNSGRISHGNNTILSKSLRNGDNENNTKNNQKTDHIKNRDAFIAPDRYSPYEGYEYNHGLLDDGTNRRRFVTTYISIDSISRNTKPNTVKQEAIHLERDPLDFLQNSTKIFIKHPNNKFEDGDLISLTGAISKQYILSTFQDNNQPSFEIPAGCNFMKVYFNHGIPDTYNDDSESIIVEFSGVRGDRGNIETSSFLGNIPTNLLNSKYPLKLDLTEEELDPNCDLTALGLPSNYLDGSDNHFFVILPINMHNPSSEDPYLLREYNYRLLFQSIVGIPLNLINADYPIGPDKLNGFHEIFDVTNDGYFIDTGISAIADLNGGGACINVAKIDSVNTGYPYPNNYVVDLGDVYHDIISAKLFSLELPNSEYVIRGADLNGLGGNNKIYWNDIDDGDYLYYIEVPPGNYTPSELKAVLEGLFFITPRLNTGEDIGATYTPNHYIQVNIDQSTDIVTFTSYKEYILTAPIVAVEPEIITDPGIDNNPPDTEYILTIYHPGHGMTTTGERILITGSINHLGIPSSVINAEYTVIEIVDENTYKIQLPRVNLSDNREDTGGGSNVTIFIPDLFRLRFDRDDTLGQVLGFRNPGDKNAVTPFSRSISNNQLYAFDIEKNAFGENIDVTNNAIQLSGYNYIYMLANPLFTLRSTGAVKKAFAKIQLCDLPGRIIFNSFVNTSKFYEDPIHELSQLEVSFITPDGRLFDFNGIEHSFTIELITVHDIPSGTGISANTGRNYNVLAD